jgi:Na+/H+ antiporter NhaB
LLKFSDLSQFIDAVTRFLVKISVKMNMYWLYNPTNKGSQFLRASF